LYIRVREGGGRKCWLTSVAYGSAASYGIFGLLQFTLVVTNVLQFNFCQIIFKIEDVGSIALKIDPVPFGIAIFVIEYISEYESI
jgi:hypothetical protein